MVLQPGNVLQQDLHRAFTQQCIGEMRNANQKLGDQLMRVLLTSKENGHGDFAVERVEVRKIMPYSLGQFAASSCHPPVKETGLPKSLGPLNQEDVLLSCCCSDVQGASSIVTGGRSQEYFWKADANPTNPPVPQAGNGGHVPTVMASGSQLAEQTSGGKANNLKCPPSRQADTGSAEEPDTGPPTREPSSGAEVNNPQYPPWQEAVKDDAPDVFPCSQQNGPSLKGSASKAKYPPLLRAVRDSAEELDTGETTEPSYGAWVNNPQYPPLEGAVKDDSTEVFPYRQQNGPSFERSASEGSYPPALQAAGGSAEELDTGQPTGEPSSEAWVYNPQYPPWQRAVKDDSPELAPVRQPEEPSSAPGINSPKDSPMNQAFEDKVATAGIEIQSREQSSYSSDINQPYPPLSLAARDDGTTPPSSAAARNEPYPPLAQAVKDQPVAQGRCQPVQPTTLPASRVSYRIDEDLELF